MTRIQDMTTIQRYSGEMLWARDSIFTQLYQMIIQGYWRSVVAFNLHNQMR